MNFVFVSPNFPSIYSHFVKALNERGLKVLGIGDTPYECLNQELKDNLTEYCYVSDLGNLQWMKNTLDYLESKYGHIDYIESNNEFWLFSDSYLREYKQVQNGFLPSEMDKIKYKSQMKQYFQEAKVKTARWIIADSYEKVINFVKEVGYPVFAKPDNGVGAACTYKINNEDDVRNFFETKPNEIYIMEEFIQGEIVSFDGIVDDESNPVLMFNETFPTPIAEVVNKDLDVYYYAKMDMPEEFREMGKRVVKAFKIRKRCFHIEFFKLTEDRPGLAKKGEILGLEVNMRSPGGDTPDLLCIAFNDSYYEVYGDVIAYNKVYKDLNQKHYISISVAKKYKFSYKHSHEEIENNYRDSIIKHGYYDKAISQAMGDEFYFARFETLEKALKFKNFVLEK